MIGTGGRADPLGLGVVGRSVVICTYSSGVEGGPNDIQRPNREVLHRGAKFNYERVSVRYDGRMVTREVVRHPGAVVVLPLLATPQGAKVVLIRNWRISIERWLYELPAGTLEAGEDPAACAARELEEETGFSAATIAPLCRFYSSPGLSDELMWAYLAMGLAPVGQRLEGGELITVHPTPARGALAMISSGELFDAKSILTLLLAEGRGLLGA